MLRRFRVAGYRSLYRFETDLDRVTVVQGANGCGKTNLYRALQLLTLAARGELARSIALEGGMPSLTWSGGERRRTTKQRKPVRVHMEADFDDWSYALSFGLPTANGGPFDFDPLVKEEHLWIGDLGEVTRKRRPSTTLLTRAAASASMTNIDGAAERYPFSLHPNESVLSQLNEPHRFPEIAQLRERLFLHRFYHQFRTDADARARSPQVSFRTPVLSDDGADLAAVFATIQAVGDADVLADVITQAFPGASIQLLVDLPRIEVGLNIPSLKRPLRAAELSDGTLRFLYLAAALLSPRPAPLLALNEPETSLHPNLLPALARLIVEAGRHSQVLVTTHSPQLAQAITEGCKEMDESLSAKVVALEIADGETRRQGVAQWFERLDDDD